MTPDWAKQANSRSSSQKRFTSLDQYDKTVSRIPKLLKLFWSSSDYQRHLDRQNGIRKKDERKRPPELHPMEKTKEFLFGTYKPPITSKSYKGKIQKNLQLRKLFAEKKRKRTRDRSFSR